ncbi:MAG: ABC transporter permease [Actinomycetales bacterium]|nr:ABC transporter permease [Actinomycetales bacterium]
MRLLDAEIRRFHARRMLLVAALVGLAAVGLALYGTYSVTRPLSADQRAAAEQAYAAELANWEEHGDERIAQCLDAQALDREQSGDATLDYGCEQMGPPQEEWFVPSAPPLGAQLSGSLTGLTFVLGFLALLAGATFTAAEASSRSLSTWLTYEPRRGRVFATKVGAAGIGVVLPAGALLGMTVGGAVAIFALMGAPTTLTADGFSPVPDVVGRLLVMTVLLAVAAAGLGLLLRHTLAVLGLAFGWAIAVEGILGSAVPRLSPWLVLPNVSAWVNGSSDYYVPQCTVSAQGTACDYATHTLTMTHGGIYLAVLTTLLVTVSALAFRRRDLA